uniref:Succinate/fumarate mitochondrial transporter n=1 Tax=Talaromyces marneffei PM1 TaxID=1077442 RepID=A0A093V6L8_TALMA
MSRRSPEGTPPTSIATTLIAGGGAGMSEVLVCHPLDTIKVRMQLSRRANRFGPPPQGVVGTAVGIVRNEGFFGLYNGLGAVIGGIIPKMAIRFTSYEYYKRLLTDKDTMKISRNGTFLAGLAAGITEAVTVVNAVEVIKIRLQALHKAPNGALVPKYKGTSEAISTLIRTEGISFLWRGVTLTALRQGTNQAANFTVYTELKTGLQKWQQQNHHNIHNKLEAKELPSYQTTIIGLISGAVGPFFNAPIDTIKTRIQQAPVIPGKSSLSHIMTITTDMLRNEGARSFYKGITPRVIGLRLVRLLPSQFMSF